MGKFKLAFAHPLGKLILIAGLALLMFLCLRWFSSKKDGFNSVPLATLSSIDPNIHLQPPDAHQQSYVILHLWASWCGPCKAEMPTLFAAKDKLPSSLSLVLVSEDDKSEDALGFIRQMGPQIPPAFLYWDEKKTISDSLNVHLFPETLIFDSDMHLVRRIAGGMNWMDPANLQFLQSLK